MLLLLQRRLLLLLLLQWLWWWLLLLPRRLLLLGPARPSNGAKGAETVRVSTGAGGAPREGRAASTRGGWEDRGV